jgi:hypothetical protein
MKGKALPLTAVTLLSLVYLAVSDFKLAFLMLAVYATTALIPFPPYDQYFTSPLVPFLLPFVAEGLRVTLLSWRQWMALLVLTVPLFFSGEISRETLTNSEAPWCQLSSFRKVVEAIKANSSPDDVVLSFWPGYVFESGRRYFPGMENHFVYRITSKIGPEARVPIPRCFQGPRHERSVHRRRSYAHYRRMDGRVLREPVTERDTGIPRGGAR